MCRCGNQLAGSQAPLAHAQWYWQLNNPTPHFSRFDTTSMHQQLRAFQVRGPHERGRQGACRTIVSSAPEVVRRTRRCWNGARLAASLLATTGAPGPGTTAAAAAAVAAAAASNGAAAAPAGCCCSAAIRLAAWLLWDARAPLPVTEPLPTSAELERRCSLDGPGAFHPARQHEA